MEYNIENEEEILIQGKGNYCWKLNKGKLKIKKLLKITILDEQELSVRSKDRTKTVQDQNSEVDEICSYLPKPGKWLSQHRYI